VFVVVAKFDIIEVFMIELDVTLSIVVPVDFILIDEPTSPRSSSTSPRSSWSSSTEAPDAGPGPAVVGGVQQVASTGERIVAAMSSRGAMTINSRGGMVEMVASSD
jgi:hypothetical protein